MSKIIVKEAVIDQKKNRHYLLKGSSGEAWVSYAEMSNPDKIIWQRLGGIGLQCLTTQSKNLIKKTIERQTEFANGFVAEEPGWLSDDVFVTPNGDVIQSKTKKTKDVIVTFESDERFQPNGRFKTWSTKVGSVIDDNGPLIFIMAFGYVGPMLRFTPAHCVNPALEIVGPRESGKSIAGVAATSIYAGSRHSQVGGGDTWSTTANALEQLRGKRRDSLFYLDEQNEQDASLSENAKAVFSNASGSPKSRYNDPSVVRQVRTVIMSSSNTSLAERGAKHRQNLEAAESRMISLIFNGPLLERTPKGFDDTRSAMDSLRNVCTKNWGVAGSKWVQFLVDISSDDKNELSSKLKRIMTMFENCVADVDFRSSRIKEMFGMAYCAAGIAQEYRCFPKLKCSAPAAVLKVAREYCRRVNIDQMPSKTQIRNLLQIANIQVIDLSKAMSISVDLNASECFIVRIPKKNGIRYFLSETALLRLFGPSLNSATKMLRAAGCLELNQSEKNRRKRKVPKSLHGIWDGNRTYCLDLED